MSDQQTPPIDTNQSPTIGALAAALAKAQGAMTAAAKDKSNPAFGAKSKYADLASTWDACRTPLAANGLAVVQQVATVQEGVRVTTTLIHSSGEWMRDRLTMPVEKRTAHGVGSAITYARRYALQAMVGIAAGDDDDGNEASGVNKDAPKEDGRREAPRQQAAKTSRTEDVKAKLAAKTEEAPGSWKRLVELGAMYGLTEEQMVKYAEPFLQGRKKVLLSDEQDIAKSLAVTHKPIVGTAVGIHTDPGHVQ